MFLTRLQPSSFICLIYLGIAFSCGSCSHLFYFPSETLYIDPKSLSPRPQEITFDSSDHRKLIGWYFDAKSQHPKARVVFFHGNAQNLSTHFKLLSWILDHDYDLFIFDYPGYGGSEGTPTQASTVDAGAKALEWVRANKPELPTVIFGQSLGGNIALYTAATQKQYMPCLVVVDSTFKSYRKVAQRFLAGHAVTWLMQPLPYLTVEESYSARDNIDKISPTPLIVVHGDQDQVVDIQNGKDVYATAKEPKEFWLVTGGEHIQAFNGDKKDIFRKKLIDSIAHYCPLSRNVNTKSDAIKTVGN